MKHYWGMLQKAGQGVPGLACLAVFLLPVVIAEGGSVLAAQLAEGRGHSVKTLQPNLLRQHAQGHLCRLPDPLVCVLVCAHQTINFSIILASFLSTNNVNNFFFSFSCTFSPLHKFLSLHPP
jgi:hypothetical protein